MERLVFFHIELFEMKRINRVFELTQWKIALESTGKPETLSLLMKLNNLFSIT